MDHSVGKVDGRFQELWVNGSMSKWSSSGVGIRTGTIYHLCWWHGQWDEVHLQQVCCKSKLCGAVHTLEGKDAIQTDLHRLERWAHANLVKFNKTKCEVLHLGQSNPQHKYKLGREWIEGSPEAAKILLALSKLKRPWSNNFFAFTEF